ncbi:hypothetical protein GALL_504410 [mine drainage metagenome]|uniref:Uncharacterized protein n=1 Tax=mine drainage metagenome TaxID=410659 RepID=A0A1J5PWI3_9ZZZZ
MVPDIAGHCVAGFLAAGLQGVGELDEFLFGGVVAFEQALIVCQVVGIVGGSTQNPEQLQLHLHVGMGLPAGLAQARQGPGQFRHLWSRHPLQSRLHALSDPEHGQQLVAQLAEDVLIKVRSGAANGILHLRCHALTQCQGVAFQGGFLVGLDHEFLEVDLERIEQRRHAAQTRVINSVIGASNLCPDQGQTLEHLLRRGP